MYGELKDMLHAELEKIQDKAEMNSSILNYVDTLSHALKDILTIEAMEKPRTRRRYDEDEYRSRY